MLKVIQTEKNPLWRGTIGGMILGSIVTMTSSLIILLTGEKGEKTYKATTIAILVSTGIGFGGGLLMGKKKEERPTEAVANKEVTTKEWKDWRNFQVVKKVKESQEITSFYLQPQDQETLPDFLPGQFLTIKLDIPEQAKPVIRTYSLSDYAQKQTFYRLSIKRELAPKGLDVPPGVSSNFMHDRVDVGSIIPCKPPNGKFFLDLQKTTPIVLVSNGVGITPMIAMAKAATIHNPQRKVWFFHGARDGSFHALREEMGELAKNNPNLYVHYAYSKPRPEDEGFYHSTGYVDTDLICSLVKEEADYFLCGSPAFMESLRSGLREAGVPDSRVFFEMFTKEKKSETKEPIETSKPTITVTTMNEQQVIFQQSQVSASWNDEAGSLLELAENTGLSPDYSCRQGICGTCECKLVEGEVEYLQPPSATVADGNVLICISKPKTAKVVLDI